jgi:hypothetical protein
MRGWILAMCAAVCAGCTVLRPVEPFSEAALFSNGERYVAMRYKPKDMPEALRAELVQASYQCQSKPGGEEFCGKVTPAGPGCVDIWRVSIEAPRVETARNRSCAGVVSPP